MLGRRQRLTGSGKTQAFIFVSSGFSWLAAHAVSLLYSLACGGLLLLAFLLHTNALRVNRLANRWLGIFLGCVGCVLLGRVLPGTTVAAQYPHLPGWVELTRLAMAPAFYFSVVQFTAPNRPLRRRDGLHFLPWLLFLLAVLPALLGGRSAGTARLPEWVATGGGLLVFATPKVQAIGYWLAAYLALRQHQRRLLQLTAQPEPIDLQWLKQVLWGLVPLVGLWLNELFFHLNWLLMLTPVGYLGAVFYLAHHALRQPEVFAFPTPVRAEIQELWQPGPPVLPDPAPGPPKQARLSPSQVAYWQQRLRQLLEAEKVYLEADLSLPALAQRAGLSAHELSYVLNEGFEVNFFQFINAYRVAEAQRLLASAQHQHLSMVGIAYEAGFSSKTTFNTTFKKVTGLTPSQFLQQVQAGSAPQPEPPGSAWLPPMGSVG